MIEDILRSLEGSKRAEPDPRVFESIRARIAVPEKLVALKSPYLALTAACLTLLISANVLALKQQNLWRNSPAVDQFELADFDLYKK